MPWSFERELGHLAFDHARIDAVVPLRQAIARNVAQEPLIQRRPLFWSHHLELWDGVTDEVQGVGKAQAVRVNFQDGQLTGFPLQSFGNGNQGGAPCPLERESYRPTNLIAENHLWEIRK